MRDWQVPFLQRLGERVPELRQRVATYLSDPNGEPSAHRFAAHMAREIGETPSAWPAEAVRELLAFLEAEQGFESHIDDLIEVWFIALLVDDGIEIQELFGPKLAKEYERYTLGYVIGGPEDRFLRGLFEAFPVFRADLDRALEFYEEHKSEGFLSPPTSSRFLLTLTSNALDRYLKGGPAEAEQFRGLLGYLEAQFGRDPELDELIESRCVELLPDPGGSDAHVLDLLGPKLRAARMRSYREAREAVPESTVRLLEQMVEAVPPLRERLREHIAKYQWALPHTFMDDVTAEAVRLHKTGQSDAIRPLLEFLEAEFGVDEFVDNVIALSFVEELPKPGELGADIENLLGPKLRAELERQRRWGEGPEGAT